MTHEELQAIRKALLKVPTDGWRHVGEHTDEMGNTSNWIVAGDYANEGEPDLVIEVWGTEDDSAYADFIAESRYLVPKLLDYINELESMPLIQTVKEQEKEIERLYNTLNEIQKHVDSCLENVNEDLRKEGSMLKNEWRKNRIRRSNKLMRVLSTEKGYLTQILSMVSRHVVHVGDKNAEHANL